MSFAIVSSNFPTTRSQGFGIGIGQVIGNVDIAGIGAASYQEFQNPALEVGAVAIATAPDDDEDIPDGIAQQTITLPSTGEGKAIEGVTVVRIGNTEYVSGSLGAFEPDTFVFNPATQELTLYSSESDAPFVGQAITYEAIQDKKVTYSDRYRGDVPRFFRQWHITGELTFNRSLEESPSGSLSFVTPRDSFDPCDLKEGTTFEWDGHGYGVASVAAVWNPVSTDGLMDVTVSLQGPHDHLIDEQVRYRGAIASITGGGNSNGIPVLPDGFTPGLVSSVGGDDEDADSTVDISFSSICTRGGVRFVGPDVTLRIDKERDTRDSTTIRGEMGRARAVEAFAYLSNPEGIEFRTWFTGRTTHRIGKSEVLNGADGETQTPINITYNITGNEWNGIKLAHEYLNTQLNLDNDEGGDESENGRVNTTIKIRSGNGLPQGGEVFKPPQDTDRSVASNAFDTGGPTREIIETTFLNDTTIARTIQRKGYLYKCADYSSPVLTEDQYFNLSSGQQEQGPGAGIVLLPTTFGNSFLPEARGAGIAALDRWEDVSSESEEFEFDSDDYLIKITKTITTHRRFKQETDARETLILEGQKALLERWRIAFGTNAEYTLSDRTISVNPDGEGNYQEVLDSINGELSQYDYFEVTEADVTEYELESMEGIYPDMPPLEDGEPDRKYVKSIRRVHKSVYEANDLSLSTPDNLLTIKTGENKDETEEVVIVYPTAGTSRDNYNSQKDLYQQTKSYKRLSGQNFKNVYAEPSEDEKVNGRPPQAQRREVFEDGNNPQSQDDPEEENNILLLNTPNNGLSAETDAIDGSVQFPSTYNKTDGLNAAICDISIQNTKAVEVWSDVLLPPIRNYCVGDKVLYQGVEYRILSISDRPRVQRRSIKRNPLVLSWGRDIDLRGAVTLSEVD